MQQNYFERIPQCLFCDNIPDLISGDILEKNTVREAERVPLYLKGNFKKPKSLNGKIQGDFTKF